MLSIRSVNSDMIVLLFVFDDSRGKDARCENDPDFVLSSARLRELEARTIVKGSEFGEIMQREFPGAAGGRGRGGGGRGPGAAGAARNRAAEGHWSLPGGVLELGERWLSRRGARGEGRDRADGRAVELIELLDRIHREGERVRYHYVIADYLCRVAGGELQAASDADAVRWVERAEWNSHSALKLDPVVRVIENGWQRALKLKV
jgi:8-oxo-dGTP diphosphatase